jgi:DNA-binding NtrC family response regulator
MLYVSNAIPLNQSVLVLRPSSYAEPACPYAATLTNCGIGLIERPTIERAHKAIQSGCRVGILILQHADELHTAESLRPFLSMQKISWVGLIAEAQIASPIVRDFIGEHLFDFVTFPVNPDHLMLTLRHAWGMAFVRDLKRDAPSQLDGTCATNDADSTMVGRTPAMHRLFEQIRKVARTDAAVLITGPSGTGKELAALSIHRQSGRRGAPFVAVNCGAIAPQLFQSELFGYEKGAFTGANQRKIGRIEAAQGGTLFLDEIGDMPFEMQVNLLRFLQEKTIVRVGGTDTLPIDVRIIAATHINLAEAVTQGRFREDLYYRINVVNISTPKLAERGEDIEIIARHYFEKFARQHNKSLRGFSKSALDALLRHHWPGNVRELMNRVQRAVVMAEGRFIQLEDLGFERPQELAQLMSLEQARATAERIMIGRALTQTRNRISSAADLLGVSRVTLYRLMEKYDISNAATTETLPLFPENEAGKLH